MPLRASNLRRVFPAFARNQSIAPCVEVAVPPSVRRDDKLEPPVSMKFAYLALGASCLAVSCLSASAAPAWAPTATGEQELRDGRPVSQVDAAPDGAVLIHAAIDIPAPPKVVWTVMSDCARANRLVVTVTSCRILESDPAHNTEVRETVTKGNLIVPTIHNVVREELQPYTVIKFQKAGGDLREEQGEWRLVALQGGAGTRVIYENLVSADIMAPAPLVRAGMRKDVAKVMINLKRECITGSDPRPVGRTRE
jgi:Polyketide cyclase / dehydrase and lipid transport